MIKKLRIIPRHNLQALVLSLCLAIIIWATAVEKNNPLRQTTVVLDIDVIENVEGVALNNPEEEVRVTLEGPSSVIQSAELSNELKAVVDLTGLSFGSQDVPIVVQNLEALDRVQIVDQYPENTRIELDRYIQREIPIKVEVSGRVASTHDYQEPSYSPQSVVISGPASKVNEIVEARATVRLSNETESIIDLARTLVFYDSNDRDGRVISLNGSSNAKSNVVSDQTNTSITIPVLEKEGVQRVLIQEQYVGTQAENYVINGVTVKPSSIVINGSPETILSIPFLRTEEIDIEGFKETQTVDVRLQIPDNIKLEDGITDTVQVTFDIEAVQDSKIITVIPEVAGIDDDLFVTNSIESLTLILAGPIDALENLDKSQIRVSLDLFELDAGIHEITVTDQNVDIPIQSVTLRDVVPNPITIELVSQRAIEATAEADNAIIATATAEAILKETKEATESEEE